MLEAYLESVRWNNAINLKGVSCGLNEVKSKKFPELCLTYTKFSSLLVLLHTLPTEVSILEIQCSQIVKL